MTNEELEEKAERFVREAKSLKLPLPVPGVKKLIVEVAEVARELVLREVRRDAC
jgi:hypothetical protein